MFEKPEVIASLMCCVVTSLMWIMGLLFYFYGWLFIIPYVSVGLICAWLTFYFFISLGDKYGRMTILQKIKLFISGHREDHYMCATLTFIVFVCWPFALLSILVVSKGWIRFK